MVVAELVVAEVAVPVPVVAVGAGVGDEVHGPLRLGSVLTTPILSGFHLVSLSKVGMKQACTYVWGVEVCLHIAIVSVFLEACRLTQQ